MERGDVAGGEDVRHAGARVVDQDAVVGLDPCLRGEIVVPFHVNAGDDQVGVQRGHAGAQHDIGFAVRFDRLDPYAGVDGGPGACVQVLDEGRGSGLIARPRLRGDASSTITSQPRVRAEEAISSPITPAPIHTTCRAWRRR